MFAMFWRKLTGRPRPPSGADALGERSERHKEQNAARDARAIEFDDERVNAVCGAKHARDASADASAEGDARAHASAGGAGAAGEFGKRAPRAHVDSDFDGDDSDFDEDGVDSDFDDAAEEEEGALIGEMEEEGALIDEIVVDKIGASKKRRVRNKCFVCATHVARYCVTGLNGVPIRRYLPDRLIKAHYPGRRLRRWREIVRGIDRDRVYGAVNHLCRACCKHMRLFDFARTVRDRQVAWRKEDARRVRILAKYVREKCSDKVPRTTDVAKLSGWEEQGDVAARVQVGQWWNKFAILNDGARKKRVVEAAEHGDDQAATREALQYLATCPPRDSKKLGRPPKRSR